MTDEPKTYTGWKAGLIVVAITAVVFSALNLLAREMREDRRQRRPAPTVTTVAP